MARKTLKVKETLELANKMLADSHEDITCLEGLTPAQAMRLGIAHLMEELLRQSGNYAGYSHQHGAVEFSEDRKQAPKILDDTKRTYAYSKSMIKEQRGW